MVSFIMSMFFSQSATKKIIKSHLVIFLLYFLIACFVLPGVIYVIFKLTGFWNLLNWMEIFLFSLKRFLNKIIIVIILRILSLVFIKILKEKIAYVSIFKSLIITTFISPINVLLVQLLNSPLINIIYYIYSIFLFRFILMKISENNGSRITAYTLMVYFGLFFIGIVSLRFGII